MIMELVLQHLIKSWTIRKLACKLPKCKIRDCTQISSSQQVSGEVETRFGFSTAPKNAAPEHCKNYKVADLPLEFECLDDCQGPKRQNYSLECEDGGECDWSEEATVDGNGPVVETLAQNWPSIDREVQHERVDCHQRTYAQLGWSCCQDGPQRNLCEGFEVSRSSMVEMETTSLERSGERQMAHTHNGSKFTGGRTWLLGKFPHLLEMQTLCRNLSRTTRVGCILLKTVEAGNSFPNVEKMVPGASGTHVRPA